MTQDQKHCRHPLDRIVYTCEARRCMDCGLVGQWDELLTQQDLPWPATREEGFG